MCDFVRVCKREANTKRNYLVLNTLQCKHLPSSPSKALNMFDRLAESLPTFYSLEKILCVGFAETATAIGFEVACYHSWDYIHTTRENEDCEFYQFSEEHSHATEQKLAFEDFGKYERILFVEDEVTTGKTIFNIIEKLQGYYPSMKYGVASILNGMSDENLEEYINRGIEVSYLEKIDNSQFSAVADNVIADGDKISIEPVSDVNTVDYERVTTSLNPRHITNAYDYNHAVEQIWENVRRMIDFKNVHRVCVVGTEEFMFPALVVGSYLENFGLDVVSHSTTRSPIEVSSDAKYPLKVRYSLPSVYDTNRGTFIYNIAKYDLVLILTENKAQDEGLSCLVDLFRLQGNDNIQVVKVG